MTRLARLVRFDGGTINWLDAQGHVLASGDLPSPAFGPVLDGMSEIAGGLTALVTRSGQITRLVLRTGDGRAGLVEAVGPLESDAAIKLDRVDACVGEVVSLPRLACLATPRSEP